MICPGELYATVVVVVALFRTLAVVVVALARVVSVLSNSEITIAGTQAFGSLSRAARSQSASGPGLAKNHSAQIPGTSSRIRSMAHDLSAGASRTMHVSSTAIAPYPISPMAANSTIDRANA